jgi:hypothetical protein
MGDLWTYCKALGANWFDDYGYLTVVPEIFQKVGPIFLPDSWVRYVEAKLDGIAKSKNREKISLLLVLAGILFAGYSAWDEQYQIATSKSPEALTVQINSLRSEIEPLKTYKQRHEVEEWPALTDSQEKTWRDDLSKFAGRLRTFQILAQDSRSEQLVDSLVKVAKDANLPEPQILNGGTPDGIMVYGRPPDIVNAFANRMSEYVGSPVKSNSDTRPEGSVVVIVIGRKNH